MKTKEDIKNHKKKPKENFKNRKPSVLEIVDADHSYFDSSVSQENQSKLKFLKQIGHDEVIPSHHKKRLFNKKDKKEKRRLLLKQKEKLEKDNKEEYKKSQFTRENTSEKAQNKLKETFKLKNKIKNKIKNEQIFPKLKLSKNSINQEGFNEEDFEILEKNIDIDVVDAVCLDLNKSK